MFWGRCLEVRKKYSEIKKGIGKHVGFCPNNNGHQNATPWRCFAELYKPVDIYTEGVQVSGTIANSKRAYFA
jgi:hypothetical protein